MQGHVSPAEDAPLQRWLPMMSQFGSVLERQTDITTFALMPPQRAGLEIFTVVGAKNRSNFCMTSGQNNSTHAAS